MKKKATFEEKNNFLIVEVITRTKCDADSRSFKKKLKFKAEYRSKWLKSYRIEENMKEKSKDA